MTIEEALVRMHEIDKLDFEKEDPGVAHIKEDSLLWDFVRHVSVHGCGEERGIAKVLMKGGRDRVRWYA